MKEILRELERYKYYINKIYKKIMKYDSYVQIKYFKIDKLMVKTQNYIKNYISYYSNGVFPKKQMVNEHNYICNKEELLRVFITNNMNDKENKIYIDILIFFDTAILMLTEFIKCKLIELFG